MMHYKEGSLVRCIVDMTAPVKGLDDCEYPLKGSIGVVKSVDKEGIMFISFMPRFTTYNNNEKTRASVNLCCYKEVELIHEGIQ